MLKSLPFILVVLACSTVAYAQNRSEIEVIADLTDAPRKVIHSHLTIPVHPGPLTLYYPEWIPGEHGPTGPISNLAGLVFTVGETTIPWRRDDVNMYALHLDVPEGATSLGVKLDFLAAADPSGFSAGACTTSTLAVLNWSELVLYPAGPPSSEIVFKPSVRVPEGWEFGTALSRTAADGTLHHFAATSLEMLVDSPVLAGRYFREVPLAPDVTPKHFLDIAADEPEDLAITDEQIKSYSRLVREAGALFASRHYDSYHFLLTLSDSVAHFGLEHHQSSDDRAEARTLVDEDSELLEADLLPHEFTHSWNGKYRRPAGLVTRNYQEPMKGDLLWVYEGLTNYVGDVLAARVGLWTPEQFRAHLALSAATQEYRPGRDWRTLDDTAVAAQTLYDAPRGWDNWRRSVDYYPEGELVWLDVDTIIREQSHGKKTLNDFAAKFYGVGGDTGPKVVPYNLDQLIAALNEIQPYDWAAYFHSKVYTVQPHAPFDGIVRGGYRMEYTSNENEFLRAALRKGGTDTWFGAGFSAGQDGIVSDVRVGSPAYQAGFGPGMKVLAVNGRKLSEDSLRAALNAAKLSPQSTEFIVENDLSYRVLHLDYHNGERFPQLVRDTAHPDLLENILKPLVPSTPQN